MARLLRGNRQIMKIWLGLASVLVIAGCSGGDDGAPGPGPEEHVTLESLPQADRDAFDHWKQQVIKDCAWQQAFPSLDEEFAVADAPAYVPGVRVDLAALRTVTDGSPLIVGTGGQLVLLDVPTVDGVVAHDTRTSRRTVNDHERVFDVSAELADGQCILKLDGKELFRGTLSAGLPVIASYDGAPPPTPGGGGDDVAALDSAALLAPVLAALVPTARAHGVLAQVFTASEADARVAFPLRPSRGPDVVRLRAVPGATPFAPGARIYGPTLVMQALFNSGTLQAELLYSGLHDDLVALRADVAVAPAGASVQVVAIAAADRVAHDDDASRSCFLQRGAASRFETIQPRSPAFDEQFAGCAMLSVDGYAALGGAVETRRAVATTAMVPGFTLGTYRGWDDALIEVAQRMDARGLALGDLDPTASIVELSLVLVRHAAVTAAITDPAARAAVRGAVVGLVFRWFFDGLDPSDALITAIGGALNLNAVAYPDSVRHMLRDLGERDDVLDAGPRAVQCGLDLVGERRAAVEHALVAVAAAPFSATFEAELRANVLQLCPTVDSLAALETSAAAVRAFVTADQARAGDSSTYPFDAEPLVSLALRQRWTDATFAALADLVGLALVSDATHCATRRSIAEQITCVDVTFDLLTANPDTGVLAPAVAARYATMARELTARWPALASAQLATIRFDLTDAWRNGLWRGCTDDGFRLAKADLYELLDAAQAATTFDERFDLEVQIASLVTDPICR